MPVKRRSQLGWWVAVLFMIGSALFAIGALPWFADAVDPRTVAVTFFVGSLFFTAAGYAQFVQTINVPQGPDVDARPPATLRLLAWQPDRTDWWAVSVQSIGTVLFNISTGSALASQLTLPQQERLIWAPDMFGSVAFMIASTLAWREACDGWWRWTPGDTGWRIAALNLAGSIAFQVSAVAAFIRPATGAVANLPVANLGTFVGAACFLWGAALLIPRTANRRPAPSS